VRLSGCCPPACPFGDQRRLHRAKQYAACLGRQQLSVLRPACLCGVNCRDLSRVCACVHAQRALGVGSSGIDEEELQVYKNS
jgi:hypothetical protein